ncbi:conserved Plasmodium protein, unknown function [Plasmodium vinckei vinckei]|uniref:Uncharacterized protein n=1 Tax=Plasmodium vinckei vinckei TaxID=54757 RepID=A0A449BTA9_PLAVN|nr:conserved Plasmodium protein, unknown function [Plasmodium vinckei vinckei]KEG02334.1 hypothetical protein YYE_03073 [Plasmodium vinckei vinckei]VEV56579.1 conserved Plasmodium protein, unknown function [Plasmodium vinckei vinckei]
MEIKGIKKQGENNNKNFVDTIKENIKKNPEQQLHNIPNENTICITNKDMQPEKINYYEHVNKKPIDLGILDSYINNNYDDFQIDDYETLPSDNCSIKELINELINNCNNIFDNNIKNKITYNFPEDNDSKDSNDSKGSKFIAESLTNEIVKYGSYNYIANSIDDKDIDMSVNNATDNIGDSALPYQTDDCKKDNFLNSYNALNEYKDNIIFTKKSKNHYPNCNTSIYMENPFYELCNKKMVKPYLTSYTSLNLYPQKKLCHLLLNNVIIKNQIQIKCNKKNSDPPFYFKITKKSMPILHTRICRKKEKNKSKQTKINYYANKHFNQCDLSNVENCSDQKTEQEKYNTFDILKLEANQNGNQNANISNEHKMVTCIKKNIDRQSAMKGSLNINEKIIDILYDNEKLDSDGVLKIKPSIRNGTSFYNSDHSRNSSKPKILKDANVCEKQKIGTSNDKHDESNIEILLKKVKLKKRKNKTYIYFYAENNFKICKLKIEPDIVKRSCKLFKNIDLSKNKKCIFTIKKDRIVKRFIKISLLNNNNFANNTNCEDKIISHLSIQNNSICEITDNIFNVSNFLILFTLIKIKSKIYICVNEINNIKIKINDIIKHIDKNINEIANIITDLKNLYNTKNTSENIKLENLMIIFLKITNIYSSTSENVKSQYNEFSSIQYNNEIIHSYIFFIKKFDKYIITSVMDIQNIYTKIKEIMKIKQNDNFFCLSFYSDLIQCLMTHYQKISIFRKILDIYLIELKNFKKYQKEYTNNKLHFIASSKCPYNLLLFSFGIKCKWLSEICIRHICNNFNLNEFDKEKKLYFSFLSEKIKTKILNKFKESNNNDAYKKLKEIQFHESLDILINNSTNNSDNSSFINTSNQPLDIENMTDLFKTNNTLEFVKNVRTFLERKNGTLPLLKENKHEHMKINKNITSTRKLIINKNSFLTNQLNEYSIKGNCKDKTKADKKEKNDKIQNSNNNDRSIKCDETKMSSNLSDKENPPKLAQTNKKDKIKIVENIKNIKKIEKKYKHMQEVKNKEKFKITLNELRLKKITKRNNIKLLKSRLLKNKKKISVPRRDMKNDTIDKASANSKINYKSKITKIVKYTHLLKANNCKVINDDKLKPSNCENTKSLYNEIIKGNSIDRETNKLSAPLRNKGKKNSHIFLNKYEKECIKNKNMSNSEQTNHYSKSEKINSDIIHIINESYRGIQKVNNKYIYMEKDYNKNVENDIKLLENSIYSNIFYDKINEPNFSENKFFFITQMDNSSKKIKPSKNSCNTIISTQTSCIKNSKNNNIASNKIIKYKLSDYFQKN